MTIPKIIWKFQWIVGVIVFQKIITDILKKNWERRGKLIGFNFLNFIKDESNGSIEKLLNSPQQYENKLQKEYYINIEKNLNNNKDNINKKKNKDKNNNKYEHIKLNTIIDIKINFIDIINKEFGIKTIGNTYYINSIIQILTHCDKFTKNFLLLENKIKENENTVSFKLLNIIYSINKLKLGNNNIIIDIRDFIQYFKKNIKILEELCKMMLRYLQSFFRGY